MTPPLFAIVRGAALHCGVTVARVLSKDRHPSVVLARHLAAAEMRENMHMSYVEIGRALGRHHSSIMYLLGALGRQRKAGNA